jgi:hypothetical protein
MIPANNDSNNPENVPSEPLSPAYSSKNPQNQQQTTAATSDTSVPFSQREGPLHHDLTLPRHRSEGMSTTAYQYPPFTALRMDANGSRRRRASAARQTSISRTLLPHRTSAVPVRISFKDERDDLAQAQSLAASSGPPY